jgi:DNA gyrase subunit A
MDQMGLRPTARYRKCAGIVGEVMKNYHPHGDAPIYEALVRMAQEFNQRYPLVDPQGNFGSVDGDPPAAMRYTEARLAKISLEMLADIDKQTVDFVPNYDENEEEPTVLPSRLPNLLVNGSSGIAVGMATNIPPHNLTEVVDGLLLVLDNPEASLDDLLRVVKGPDFPTRGYIYGTAGIREAFATGRGSIVMRARAHTEKLRGGREAIIVTELPYQVNKATLIARIAELVRERKLDGIAEIRDESDRHGIRVVMELSRGEIAQIILNQLYKHTAMQDTFGVNMLALVNKRPQVVPLKEMLALFIEFRREVIVRRTRYDLARAEERAHILEGLRKALDQIDLVIRLIRSAESVDAARQALMSQLELSEVQAKAILAMQLQRLARLEREKIVAEHMETLQLIERLRAILASDALVREIIREELTALKAEYGDERRTEIVEETVELSLEDLIADEEMVVTVTRSGYIKRTAIEAYRSQRRGGKGVQGMETKEEDVVEAMYIASTHSYLLFFTNDGKVHWLKVHEIPEAKRDARGKAMVNLLHLAEGERVAATLAVRDFAAGGYVFFATRQGKVKKTELAAYSRPQRGGIRAIALEESDEVIAVRQTDGQRRLLLETRQGTCIQFEEEEVRPMGRVAAGVKGIELEEGDHIIAAEVVRDDSSILTVTERGYGKKTPISEYRLQSRGGKGILDIKTGGRNGLVVGMVQVGQGDEILLVTTKGKVIRFPAEDVSSQGRNTWGVRVIDLDADDRVGSLARVEAERGANA